MNSGELYRHKQYKHLTIELVKPTNRGWQVVERNENGTAKQKHGVTKYYYNSDFQWWEKVM